MPDATEIFKYEKRNYYPHMMPKDVEIWNRYIEQNPNAYDTVAYDFKVGSVPEFLKDHDSIGMQNEAALYQKKIDVVGYKNGQIDIIELKPRASMSTIGQVKGYVALFKRDTKSTAIISPLIITDVIMPDMDELAKGEGVLIVAV